MVVILPSIFGNFIGIMSGSLIIEKIFSIPGVGQLYINSINAPDYPLFIMITAFYTSIGLLAGIIGVGATYLISIIVNAILRPLIGYASIAALPISQAVLLVCISILLTLISGLIPASGAAKKDPVVALRTE
jgi:putative ABC transport system permease protein